VRIRAAQQHDFVAIAALHAASWRSSYRGILSNTFLDSDISSERKVFWKQRFKNTKANQYVVVAEDDANIVGFACAFGNEDEVWGTFLDNLHVVPARTGQGIGGKLIANVALWCSGKFPGKGLFLWTFERNGLARRFYEQLGGVVVGNTIWIAPDGTAVMELRYAWKNADLLIHSKKSIP
jgi:GNAT superfamily N-acetyltransferase